MTKIIEHTNKKSKKLLISKLIFVVFMILLLQNLYAQHNENLKNNKINSKQEKPQPNDTINRDNDNLDIDQKIENIAENTESDVDYTELMDDLEYYSKKPINLNKATADELRKLQMLTEVQIVNLLEHIRINGNLLSLFELQTINAFDLETIYKILPYVDVPINKEERQVTFQEMHKYSKNQAFFRYQRTIEEQNGFTPVDSAYLARYPSSRYLGSPDKLYFKYRFTYLNNISMGITGEKDQGEEFFKGSQKQGFDYYSAHLYIKNIWKIKTLAIGDFHAQFGQGLTFWSGLAFGKSADVSGIKKSGLGLKPYASADENNFLRGIGITHQIGKIELTAFVSRKKVDANIGEIDSLNQEEQYVTSLQESGFHSTVSEVADKDQITQTIAGAHLAYKSRKLNIGGTFSNYQLSKALQKSTYLYNQFDFTGDKLTNIGVDYSYLYRNINLFGEISRSDNGSIAMLNGLLISLDSKVSLSFLHRNYPKEYQNLVCNAFAESSKPANEQGIYTGLNLKLHPFWTFSMYYDNFKFPWLKFQVDAPSKGFDFISQMNYKPSKKVDMYFRYRQEDKEANNSLSTDIATSLITTSKKNIRYHVSYKVSSAFTFKNRVELTWIKDENPDLHTGFLVYQGVAYRAMKSPVTFSFRYAVFSTDDYDSRMYAYENDVLYASSFPSYYYKGSRYYIVMKYAATRKLDFWLRFSQTIYSNQNTISSGLTEIQGNTKSEIKAQVRYKF